MHQTQAVCTEAKLQCKILSHKAFRINNIDLPNNRSVLASNGIFKGMNRCRTDFSLVFLELSNRLDQSKVKKTGQIPPVWFG